jgi:hypothetical protein
MLTDSPPLLDIMAFLEAQRRERFRAFVIHGPPLAGKTRFARKLAETTGGIYLDVLAYVTNCPDLAQKVDLLDVPFLKRLSLAVAPPEEHQEAGIAPLVVVDEFDFLVPIWGDLEPFIEMVRKLSLTETRGVMAFVLQSRPSLDGLSMPITSGRNRVLRLEEIQNL